MLTDILGPKVNALGQYLTCGKYFLVFEAFSIHSFTGFWNKLLQDGMERTIVISSLEFQICGCSSPLYKMVENLYHLYFIFSIFSFSLIHSNYTYLWGIVWCLDMYAICIDKIGVTGIFISLDSIICLCLEHSKLFPLAILKCSVDCC
jgi:hypothetical protein